nr:MAG TPA: hypothetical protein [Caudoviricetes sp.]
MTIRAAFTILNRYDSSQDNYIILIKILPLFI